MNKPIKLVSVALVWLGTGAAGLVLVASAIAQQAAPADVAVKAPPSKSTAQIDAGEPRADTSVIAPNAAVSSVAAAAPASAAASGVATRTSPRPAPRASAEQKAPGASDRLNLGTATVTGDREQPKVMYVVPWKSSDIGELSGKPMNSLLDEALAPVDRDEFKREVAYYDAVNADASHKGASGSRQIQGEK